MEASNLVDQAILGCHLSILLLVLAMILYDVICELEGQVHGKQG
jgi:hypothetical protein